MTVSELRRQELLVRLPHAFLAVLAIAGSLILASAFAQPGLLAMPDLVRPSAVPNWPTRLLLPAVAPLALELLLGASLAFVSAARGSFTLRLERRAEHLAPEPATVVIEHVLARLTALGFDGKVEQPTGKTVIAVARPRAHAFRGFAGLPLGGSITIEEIGGVSHVCAVLRATTFIVRDTGESLYLEQLVGYLSGHAEAMQTVRGPAAGMNFAVTYAALAVALTAMSARSGSLGLAVYADTTTMLGLVTGALTLFAIAFRWRTAVGLPETVAALVAVVVTRLMLVGFQPGF